MSPTETEAPALPPPAPISIPADLVKAVNDRKCILFLGAMASARTPKGCPFQYDQGPPGGGELSRRLAELCKYSENECWNLARVSLYFETRKDKSRHALVDAIAEQVAAKTLVPSPALHMLAALPFPIIVTTNYDQLFETALLKAKANDGEGTKNPQVTVYDPERNHGYHNVPLDPTPDEPVVFKLHGDIKKRESLVVTEEDYMTFIQRMSANHFHPVPESIRARMTSWRILFVGYSLKDYNLRLLLRALRWTVDPSNVPLSYSVDPRPDDVVMKVWQERDPKIVNFIEQDLWYFVPALYRECMGADYQPEQ